MTGFVEEAAMGLGCGRDELEEGIGFLETDAEEAEFVDCEWPWEDEEAAERRARRCLDRSRAGICMETSSSESSLLEIEILASAGASTPTRTSVGVGATKGEGRAPPPEAATVASDEDAEVDGRELTDPQLDEEDVETPARVEAVLDTDCARAELETSGPGARGWNGRTDWMMLGPIAAAALEEEEEDADPGALREAVEERGAEGWGRMNGGPGGGGRSA